MLSENRFAKAAKDEAIAVVGGFVHINDANGSFSIVLARKSLLHAASDKRNFACRLKCNITITATGLFTLAGAQYLAPAIVGYLRKLAGARNHSTDPSSDSFPKHARN